MTRFLPPFAAATLLFTGASCLAADAATDAATVPAPKVLIDRFGQSTQSDWPNKLKSEAELKRDLASDAAGHLAEIVDF